jgi:hypothetical protein
MAGEVQEQKVSVREARPNRVAGALIGPRATFGSIAKRPDWLLPMLLLMAVGVAVVFSFGQRIGWRQLIETQLAGNARFAQLSPQQQEQAIDRAIKLAPTAAYAETTVGVVIVLLIFAGILLLAFNIVFGTKIRFNQSYSIATYSFLPQAVKGLLALVVVWVRPPQGVDAQNLVMSNAGAFLSAGAPVWLRLLASSFDVFSLWTMGLLAIGFSAAGASEKVSAKSAFALVFALWLIYLIVAVGLTAAFA